jgi:hypothetical protein
MLLSLLPRGDDLDGNTETFLLEVVAEEQGGLPYGQKLIVARKPIVST